MPFRERREPVPGVLEGRAHAALVFDGARAVGWLEYGTPAELPNIYHRKEYEAGLEQLPDYRLTCFFTDRSYRHRGVSSVALQGALTLIAQSGGGRVEAYPQDTGGKKITASFPLQRHPPPLRKSRLHLRALQGQEPLRHEQDRGSEQLMSPGVCRPAPEGWWVGGGD